MFKKSLIVMKKHVFLFLTALILCFLNTSYSSAKTIIKGQIPKIRDLSIQEYTNDYNLRCPIKISNELTLTKVEYTTGLYVVYYIEGIEGMHFSQDNVTAEMKNNIVQDLRINSEYDFSIAELLSDMKECGVGFIYHYYTSDSFMEIVIKADELEYTAPDYDNILVKAYEEDDYYDDDDDEAITEYVYEAPNAEEEEIQEAAVFKVAEEMPEFPGGPEKLLEYLNENLRYPEMARENDIQGRVYVQFVVEPDGSISNVEVIRSIGGGCDEEAVRLVQNMPKFKPGKMNGYPVRVQYTVPVKFMLND